MSEKTEQPTAKKLRDARKKGDVAYSKDTTQTVLLIGIFAYLWTATAGMLDAMSEMILFPATLLTMDFRDAANVLVTELAYMAARLVAPFLGIVLAFGIVSDALQVGPVLAVEKIKPSGRKLNAIANLKNIFSKKNLIELLKSIVKIGFLSTLVWLLLAHALPVFVRLPYAGADGLRDVLAALISTMFIHIGLGYAVLAAADLVWQRLQFRKGLMMAKEEIKQEYKEMEGDPHIKQKRKHLHQEMLHEAAVDHARSATVLVTNPTHIAVALRYDEDETPLPVLMAVGEGALAERMKRAAIEAGVPVMQNVPLARALAEQGSPGEYIPSALVEPVAELLRLLRQLGPEGIPPPD